MMAKFYGFYNTYSIDTRDNDNERIGYVMVFTSRKAREEWVNGDNLRNGSYHCEVITAREARREMLRVAYDYMLNEHIVYGRSDLKYLPMGTIIKEYCWAML